MSSQASSFQVRTPPDGVTGGSAGNLWKVWCLIAGITSTILGIYWDISWHMSIGRDSFWTAPHLAIYVGAILGGLGAAASILPTTFGRGPMAQVAPGDISAAFGVSVGRLAHSCAPGVALPC